MKRSEQILKIAIGLLISLQSFGQIPTNGRISYLKFSQSNSNSVSITDEMGNNNGAVTNGTGFYTDRKSVAGQAVSLGGSGNGFNYITLNATGNSTTINALSDISLSLWYKKEDGTGTTPRPVIGVGDANKYYQLNYDPTNNKFSFIHYNGTVTSTIIESSVVTTGTWNQVGVTISPTNNVCSLYLNGSIQSSNTQPISMPVNPAISLSRRIGTTFPNFPATFDDFYVYGRVLNASEMYSFYDDVCSSYFSSFPTITFNGSSLVTQTFAGANYLWGFNGNSISGNNSNIFQSTISAGLYTVTIANATCKAVATFTQATDVVNVNNGLLVYYPLDNNSNDFGPNSLNGVTLGNVTITSNRFETNNSAFDFGGTPADLVQINNNSLFTISDSYTISLWYKPFNSIITTTQDLISKGYDTGNNFLIRTGNFNSLFTQTTGLARYGSSNTLTSIINTWRHVVMVVSKSDSKMYTYLNGVLTSTTNINGININNSEFLTIGQHSRQDAAGAFRYAYRGKIDDVRIHSRALNPSEISALWDNCIGVDINTMNLPISGSNSVCLGSVNNYSIPTTTGISYNWAVSGGNTFTINGNNLAITANNIGNYTITAVPTYACGAGTVTSSLVVSVNSNPASPTITGNLMPKSCVQETYSAVSATSSSYTWSTNENHVLAASSAVGITFTSTGIKQISVVSIDTQCNFTTTSSISVTVSAPNLATPIVTRTSSLANIQSTNVTASGVSFQWVKDNLDEAGETSNVHANALENATYKLRADLGLCATAVSDPYHVFVVTFIPAAVTVVSPPVTVTSTVTVSSPPVTVTSVVTVSSPPVTVTSVINNCTATGTNNNRISTKFSVYPNPSNGVFTIESDGVEIFSLKVYASDGRLVYNEKYTSRLDLSNLPNGIYKLIAFDRENIALGSVNLVVEK